MKCPNLNKLRFSLRGLELLDGQGNPLFCELQRSQELRTAPSTSHPHIISVILLIFFCDTLNILL